MRRLGALDIVVVVVVHPLLQSISFLPKHILNVGNLSQLIAAHYFVLCRTSSNF